LPEPDWTSLPELGRPWLPSQVDQLGRTTGGPDSPSCDRGEIAAGVGVTFYAQALLVQPPAAYLTNLTADTILK
jgi:hypothetical protein